MPKNRIIELEDAAGDAGSAAAAIDTAAVAREISGRGKAARAGIAGLFAARIAAARRSGLPPDQIAAMIHAINQEKKAAMKAAAEATAQELTGRMAAASRDNAASRKKPGKGGSKPPSPRHH